MISQNTIGAQAFGQRGMLRQFDGRAVESDFAHDLWEMLSKLFETDSSNLARLVY